MGTIAVFDSGFGSLSIIKAIQRHTKADIIYFADKKNFPYGKKTKKELEKIIKNTINNLKEKFHPDLIVIASNTPSLLVDKIITTDPMVMGVLPPILNAQQLTKTNSIALLVTSSAAKSAALNNFIKKNKKTKIKILKIDSSKLVDLVESGKFLYDKNYCIKKIISVLQQKFIFNNVDVATLSSTHLPFLLPLLQKIFPHVKFLDPANDIVKRITTNNFFSPSIKNTLVIYTSGNVKKFQKDLSNMGIKKIVYRINL